MGEAAAVEASSCRREEVIGCRLFEPPIIAAESKFLSCNGPMVCRSSSVELAQGCHHGFTVCKLRSMARYFIWPGLAVRTNKLGQHFE